MAHILLALHDAGGTVPPMVAIGQALVARGHRVTVLGQPSVERPAVAAGCEFRRFSAPDYETDRPIEEQIEPVMELMAGLQPGTELLEAIEDTGAGAVVVDANLAGVAAAAESSPIPSAVLFHSMFATYVDTWFGDVWPFVQPAINGARSAYDLPEAETWLDVFLPHQRRYAVVPEVFDAHTSLTGPPPCDHFGFLVPTPGSAASDDPWTPSGVHQHNVLISLSTTDLDQAALLQAILDGLDGEDVGALLTTGRQRLPTDLRVPPNVQVRGHVPHSSVLPEVDAVITHAGMGTVAAALSHGVPLVCTPISRDQPLNAGRVTELGAGVTVPAHEVTPDRVRAALQQVLGDPSYRAAAQGLAHASRDAGGADALAADLEALAG
jgi:UDP:flavonoid glycosyltransferase YjiC (YdhE family)